MNTTPHKSKQLSGLTKFLWAIGFVFVIGLVAFPIAGNQILNAKAPVLRQEKVVELSSSESIEELEQKFKESTDELREVIKVLRRHELTFFHVDSESSHAERELWEEAAEKSEKIYSRFNKNALALFDAKKNPSPALVFIIRNINKKLFVEGKIERCYKITKRLLSMSPDDQDLKTDMARVALLNNDFDFALEFAKANRPLIQTFSSKEQVLFSYLEELKTTYQRELKLQEKDKSANLPRVEMTIQGKGKIVIELFEDEAPETVANFISLVETGIFDGIIFHRVIQAYMSHSGRMTMDKLQPIGYTIYDECGREDRRHHFRGSLATWSDFSQPNSCGAEFALMNVPGPYLTKANHTVFGRIISGMDVFDNLQPTFTMNEEEQKEEPILEITPDTIESIKIIRKRDHEYEPNRVQQ